MRFEPVMTGGTRSKVPLSEAGPAAVQIGRAHV